MVSVAMGASSSSGLAVKGVNSAIRRVASDQNKVRHIMQSKHEWTKVTKKNQWKYVKPIVKKEMKLYINLYTIIKRKLSKVHV